MKNKTVTTNSNDEFLLKSLNEFIKYGRIGYLAELMNIEIFSDTYESKCPNCNFKNIFLDEDLDYGYYCAKCKKLSAWNLKSKGKRNPNQKKAIICKSRVHAIRCPKCKKLSYLNTNLIFLPKGKEQYIDCSFCHKVPFSHGTILGGMNIGDFVIRTFILSNIEQPLPPSTIVQKYKDQKFYGKIFFSGTNNTLRSDIKRINHVLFECFGPLEWIPDNFIRSIYERNGFIPRGGVDRTWRAEYFYRELIQISKKLREPRERFNFVFQLLLTVPKNLNLEMQDKHDYFKEILFKYITKKEISKTTRRIKALLKDIADH